MNTLRQKLFSLLIRLRANGFLQVCYALMSEALFIGYLFFIGLFTVETLLPTFVTARLSLTKFFFLLTLGALLLSLLGKFLNISFPWNISKKHPLLWLGILWTVGILAVSLFKFPLITIPILIALLLFSLSLFWQIFFDETA